MIDREKKEQIEKKMLIDALNNMPARVIATAYLHAMNYHLYGVDVTEKWKTATQNTANVERAYLKGRRDEAEFWFRAKPDELLLSRKGVLDLHKKYESLVAPDMTKYGYELESLSTVRGPRYTVEGAIEYLDSVGWLRKHDWKMMLEGIHRYADDPYLEDIRTAILNVGIDKGEVQLRIDGKMFGIRRIVEEPKE